MVRGDLAARFNDENERFYVPIDDYDNNLVKRVVTCIIRNKGFDPSSWTGYREQGMLAIIATFMLNHQVALGLDDAMHGRAKEILTRVNEKYLPESLRATA